MIANSFTVKNAINICLFQIIGFSDSRYLKNLRGIYGTTAQNHFLAFKGFSNSLLSLINIVKIMNQSGWEILACVKSFFFGGSFKPSRADNFDTCCFIIFNDKSRC